MKMSGASNLVRTFARSKELLYGSPVIGFRSGRKSSGFIVFLIFENGRDIGYTYQELMAINGCYLTTQ